MFRFTRIRAALARNYKLLGRGRFPGENIATNFDGARHVLKQYEPIHQPTHVTRSYSDDSNHVHPKDMFTKFVSQCYRNRGRKRMDKTLLSYIQSFMKNEPSFYPSSGISSCILGISLEAQNSDLADHALRFMMKCEDDHFVEEDVFVSVIQLAGQTHHSELLTIACWLLDQSLGEKVARAHTFIAKVCAYASVGDFEYAHNSLFALESLYRGSQEDEYLFSPFSTLQPLVMAYSQNGCASLDNIYYQLEDLSQKNSQDKSIAALNCLILGCANIGDAVRAWQTFEAIETMFGLTPDIDSYNCLICAYFKGDEREEALKIFEEFEYFGVEANAMTYKLLVDAHIAARDCKSALAIIDEMVMSGFEPTKKVLKKIFSAAVMEKDASSKDRVRAMAIEFNISMSSKVLDPASEEDGVSEEGARAKGSKSSWEAKFEFREKKVKLRSLRGLEARRNKQETGKKKKGKKFGNRKWSRSRRNKK